MTYVTFKETTRCTFTRICVADKFFELSWNYYPIFLKTNITFDFLFDFRYDTLKILNITLTLIQSYLFLFIVREMKSRAIFHY